MSCCGCCMFWDDGGVPTSKDGVCEFSSLPIGRDCYCRHFWSVFGFVKVDKKRSEKVSEFLELRY